eukprot:10524181-Alexandrium_andersonii.AAC.1
MQNVTTSQKTSQDHSAGAVFGARWQEHRARRVVLAGRDLLFASIRIRGTASSGVGGGRDFWPVVMTCVRR